MNTLRVKIQTKSENEPKRVDKAEAVKALKGYDEYTSAELLVLGVPFGGPYEGRDSDGEAFHKGTNIWLQKGDTVPVTYYHGFGPDSPDDWQETPAIIGLAKYVGVNKKGHLFEAKLDESEELALRILADPKNAKASSGAISHLVRMGNANMIDVWPVGELALFDINEWRLPANDFAVVEKKSDAGDRGLIGIDHGSEFKRNIIRRNLEKKRNEVFNRKAL